MREKTAQAFFEQLQEGASEQIQTVAIDMTTACEIESQAHCPSDEIVYDVFHVVANYRRQVIGERSVSITPTTCTTKRPPASSSSPADGCYCE